MFVAAAMLGALAVGTLSSSAAGAVVPTRATSSATLKILVTNDDGPTTPGLGALVQALIKIPGTSVMVVMPATNESGTGSSTTPGPLTATKTTTTGGYPAYAVNGTPADTVNWALANLRRPQLVVSGVNDGQNLGGFTSISGTVGAARTAARLGIPALAVSQGYVTVGSPVGIPYNLAAAYAVTWVKQHRAAVLKPKKGAAVVLQNLNVPTCPTGSIRGEITVPAATTTTDALTSPNCTSTAMNPSNDIEAFLDGYAPISPLTP
jgi:5'-nucleotidase